MATQIAVFVDGDKNTTRVTVPHDFNEAGLESLARHIRRKAPGRDYDVHYVKDTRRGIKRSGDTPLYTWHVGDGFEHHEGWWISTD